MPTKNAIKEYVAGSFYHVYSRGVNKEQIFLDEADKTFFLSLFKRYLSAEKAVSPARVLYKNFSPEVSLLAYCLMDNHIHLLLYQKNEDSMARFMRSMMTSYSMYFNKKYHRVGPVFQSRYLASRIDSDAYLHHISRYIHLNPSSWRTYPFSSIAYYSGEKTAQWLSEHLILELFEDSREKYLRFVADYEASENMMDELAYELAIEPSQD